MVMGSKIGQLDAQFMMEACLDLACEGLRTLVVAQKVISPDSSFLLLYRLRQMEGVVGGCFSQSQKQRLKDKRSS